ncbi:MAG TPA: CBS domain-containing protein [Thermoanaerobaculia bacterium]|nr:CBS domain-containing protein [Thermoanaerobaculia bacterium]
MRVISEIIEGKPLYHVQASQSVRDVVRQMSDKNIGAVAVLEGKNLVGVFSERDLMSRVVARELDPGSTSVAEVMTRDIIVASPSDPFDECLRKMKSRNFRHLPVTEKGSLIGMISLRDLLQVDSELANEKVSLLQELVTYSPDYES